MAPLRKKMSAADQIRLLVLDVDGVMTDGGIRLDARGGEVKVFDVKDGYGLSRLIGAGVEVAIITGRSSPAVALRARELGIVEVHQGVADKGALLDELMANRGLRREEVCCVGDDIPDIPLLDRAGLSVAVADACAEVRAAAAVTTKAGGGRGAVREVCEMILGARGEWP
jgi:3-deoxy-D-manno-octulosonate 8-phosphate phosphatase (KDO 8-P phosphatase)